MSESDYEPESDQNDPDRKLKRKDGPGSDENGNVKRQRDNPELVNHVNPVARELVSASVLEKTIREFYPFNVNVHSPQSPGQSITWLKGYQEKAAIVSVAGLWILVKLIDQGHLTGRYVLVTFTAAAPSMELTPLTRLRVDVPGLEFGGRTAPNLWLDGKAPGPWLDSVHRAMLKVLRAMHDLDHDALLSAITALSSADTASAVQMLEDVTTVATVRAGGQVHQVQRLRAPDNGGPYLHIGHPAVSGQITQLITVQGVRFGFPVSGDGVSAATAFEQAQGLVSYLDVADQRQLGSTFLSPLEQLTVLAQVENFRNRDCDPDYVVSLSDKHYNDVADAAVRSVLQFPAGVMDIIRAYFVRTPSTQKPPVAYIQRILRDNFGGDMFHHLEISTEHRAHRVTLALLNKDVSCSDHKTTWVNACGKCVRPIRGALVSRVEATVQTTTIPPNGRSTTSTHQTCFSDANVLDPNHVKPGNRFVVHVTVDPGPPLRFERPDAPSLASTVATTLISELSKWALGGKDGKTPCAFILRVRGHQVTGGPFRIPREKVLAWCVHVAVQIGATPSDPTTEFAVPPDLLHWCGVLFSKYGSGYVGPVVLTLLDREDLTRVRHDVRLQAQCRVRVGGNAIRRVGVRTSERGILSALTAVLKTAGHPLTVEVCGTPVPVADAWDTAPRLLAQALDQVLRGAPPDSLIELGQRAWSTKPDFGPWDASFEPPLPPEAETALLEHLGFQGFVDHAEQARQLIDADGELGKLVRKLSTMHTCATPDGAPPRIIVKRVLLHPIVVALAMRMAQKLRGCDRCREVEALLEIEAPQKLASQFPANHFGHTQVKRGPDLPTAGADDPDDVVMSPSLVLSPSPDELEKGTISHFGFATHEELNILFGTQRVASGPGGWLVFDPMPRLCADGIDCRPHPARARKSNKTIVTCAGKPVVVFVASRPCKAKSAEPVAEPVAE